MEQLVIEIAGIGQATSAVLTKHGFKTVADVASTSVDSLSVVPGFANSRSLQTIKKAKELLQAVNVSASKAVSDSLVSKEKVVSEKPIKNNKNKNKAKKVLKKKAAKNKDKKAEKNKLKQVAKELAKKVAKLKDKAKKATKKKNSKKSKKK